MTQTIRAYDKAVIATFFSCNGLWHIADELHHELTRRQDRREWRRRVRQAKRVSRAYSQAIIRR